jgi:hypothetical protein
VTTAAASVGTRLPASEYRRLAGRVKLLCAYLAGALLVGLVGNALFGAWWLDPAVGLLIAAVAVKEGLEAWSGEGCACLVDPLVGPEPQSHGDHCCDD